ncbi:hypothetical protein BKH41_05540 [Helicobacter sp. 12S02232-10]|uniref:flagellar FLiS export co-chaperone n=1 Tax=Helicobacter sp. 12S02232-10 TaxID=1476197 RepID=UPI000BA5EF7A|nr:flagellar FLiS export co-chaperone [Helicobacter sp. 12S02232-10]PAF48726.1 hypothetical protein BKH41_05540 [Helicobacter sp. 12S02232-10]
MFDKDMLATFKKHLVGMDKIQGEDIDPNSLGKSKKIRKFGEDVKSANEFIGAVQILDAALAKLISLSQRMLVEGEIKTSDLKSLEGIVSKEMCEIIQNSSFMGTELFDAVLSVEIHSKAIEVEVSNPMSLVANEGYEGVIAYLEDKRADISKALEFVSVQVSDQRVFEPDVSAPSSYESFNAKDFLKMF